MRVCSVAVQFGREERLGGYLVPQRRGTAALLLSCASQLRVPGIAHMRVCNPASPS